MLDFIAIVFLLIAGQCGAQVRCPPPPERHSIKPHGLVESNGVVIAFYIGPSERLFRLTCINGVWQGDAVPLEGQPKTTTLSSATKPHTRNSTTKLTHKSSRSGFGRLSNQNHIISDNRNGSRSSSHSNLENREQKTALVTILSKAANTSRTSRPSLPSSNQMTEPRSCGSLPSKQDTITLIAGNQLVFECRSVFDPRSFARCKPGGRWTVSLLLACPSRRDRTPPSTSRVGLRIRTRADCPNEDSDGASGAADCKKRLLQRGRPTGTSANYTLQYYCAGGTFSRLRGRHFMLKCIAGGRWLGQLSSRRSPLPDSADSHTDDKCKKKPLGDHSVGCRETPSRTPLERLSKPANTRNAALVHTAAHYGHVYSPRYVGGYPHTHRIIYRPHYVTGYRNHRRNNYWPQYHHHYDHHYNHNRRGHRHRSHYAPSYYRPNHASTQYGHHTSYGQDHGQHHAYHYTTEKPSKTTTTTSKPILATFSLSPFRTTTRRQ